MPEYDNTNRGVLFTNERKMEEHHSDYQGELNVEGKAYWLNAWLNTSKNGKKYLSVKVKAKTDGRSSQKPEMADEIPF